MLFAVKRNLIPMLAAMVLLAALSFGAHEVFGISGDPAFARTSLRDILIGMLAIGVGDGLIHLLCRWRIGAAYVLIYGALVDYFRSQGRVEILFGGILAAFEEVFFRGVVLEWVRGTLGATSAVAVCGAALLFGLAHFIPSRRLAPFALWAVWEGVLLGTIYVTTGSLAITAIIHGLHDIGGFSWFAYERRRRALASESQA